MYTVRKIDQDNGNQEYDRFKGREHLILLRIRILQ